MSLLPSQLFPHDPFSEGCGEIVIEDGIPETESNWFLISKNWVSQKGFVGMLHLLFESHGVWGFFKHLMES